MPRQHRGSAAWSLRLFRLACLSAACVVLRALARDSSAVASPDLFVLPGSLRGRASRVGLQANSDLRGLGSPNELPRRPQPSIFDSARDALRSIGAVAFIVAALLAPSVSSPASAKSLLAEYREQELAYDEFVSGAGKKAAAAKTKKEEEAKAEADRKKKLAEKDAARKAEAEAKKADLAKRTAEIQAKRKAESDAKKAELTKKMAEIEANRKLEEQAKKSELAAKKAALEAKAKAEAKAEAAAKAKASAAAKPEAKPAAAPAPAAPVPAVATKAPAAATRKPSTPKKPAPTSPKEVVAEKSNAKDAAKRGLQAAEKAKDDAAAKAKELATKLEEAEKGVLKADEEYKNAKGASEKASKLAALKQSREKKTSAAKAKKDSELEVLQAKKRFTQAKDEADLAEKSYQVEKQGLKSKLEGLRGGTLKKLEKTLQTTQQEEQVAKQKSEELKLKLDEAMSGDKSVKQRASADIQKAKAEYKAAKEAEIKADPGGFLYSPRKELAKVTVEKERQLKKVQATENKAVKAADSTLSKLKKAKDEADKVTREVGTRLKEAEAGLAAGKKEEDGLAQALEAAEPKKVFFGLF